MKNIIIKIHVKMIILFITKNFVYVPNLMIKLLIIELMQKKT